jgi:protocatechuate 3,4-dioxygenase beta subunit
VKTPQARRGRSERPRPEANGEDVRHDARTLAGIRLWILLPLLVASATPLFLGGVLRSARTADQGAPALPGARSFEPPPAASVEPPARLAASTQRTTAALAATTAPAPEREADALAPPEESALSRIEITVREAGSGRAVPGARVELGHTARGAFAESLRVTRSDSAGRVRVELAPGDLRLVGWKDRLTASPVHVELVAGGDATAELLLELGHEVAGRVVDAATDLPVPGATIAFWTHSERDVVRAGPDGGFVHVRFPRTEFAEQVVVTAPGYGRAVRYLEVAEDGWTVPAAFDDGEETSGTGSPWIEIALVPELRVAGQVVDEAGEPVAGATVTVEGFFHVLPGVASCDGAEGTTDAEGAFAFAGLRSDVGHGLLVSAPGFAERTLELPVAAGAIELARIRLAQETVLAGVVIDAEGFPVEDVEVLLHPLDADAPDGREPASALDVSVRVEGTRRSARSSPAGTFVFESLRPVPHRLIVVRDAEPLVVVEVEPVAGATFPDVQLQLEADCLTLRGRLEDAHGPVAGAEVEVARFGTVARVTTDGEGRFRVAGLDAEAAYEFSAALAAPGADGATLHARAEAWAFEEPLLVLSPGTQGAPSVAATLVVARDGDR